MRRHPAPLVALLLYTALGLLLFAPVLDRFASACLANPSGEVSMKLWDQWRTSESLLARGALPEETHLVDFPGGGALFPSDPGNSVFFLPVYAAFGPEARFNAAPLAQLVLGALATFALALQLTRSPGGALVAGTAFGFSPFLLSYALESGCSEAAAVAGFPLLLLFLLRTLRGPGLANPALAGACAFLLAFSSLYYGVFGLLLVAYVALGTAAFARRGSDLWPGEEEAGEPLVSRGPAARLLVFAAVAGLLALPLASTVLRTLGSPRSVLPREELSERREVFDARGATSSVLADMVTPGKAALRERDVETRLVRTTYTGLLVLGLAAAALRRRSPLVAFLAGGAGFFLLLSLGPHLALGGALRGPDSGNLLFLAFFHGFPLFDRIFEPFRLHVLVTLFLAVLAAIGFRELSGGRRGLAAGLAVSLLVMAEYLLVSPAPFPLSVTVPERPAWCARLRADPRPYAVLPLPFTLRGGPLFHKRVFWLQTLHRRPLPNGVAFYPPLARESAVYRELLEHEGGELAPWDRQAAPAGFAELGRRGFGRVLAHREAYLPEAWRDVSGFLTEVLGAPESLGDDVYSWDLGSGGDPVAPGEPRPAPP